MNKQEVIDEIENAIPDFILNDFHRGRETGLTYALELVEELDEPEKPVVPKYVADFYESIKDDFEDKLYELCLQFNNGSDDLPREIWWWFDCGKNEPIQTLVKMKIYGYKVEEEKLYTVELPNPNSAGGKLVLSKQQSTGRLILKMLNSDINKPKYLHLTEAEIKKDFDWLWQFAKELKDKDQEKLYTVEFQNPNSDNHLVLRKNFDGKVCVSLLHSEYWRGNESTRLTESEIKQDFEWAWQFAEEVEE